MKADLSKPQKYSLNNLCNVIQIVSCLLLINIQTNDVLAQAVGNDNLIENTDYKYKLFYDKNNHTDCVGTLTITLNKPADIYEILFERTSRQQTVTTERPLLLVKSLYSSEVDTICKTELYWDTYFRLTYILNDNNRLISPIYCVNDYINTDDLELLKSQTIVNNIESSFPTIYIKERNVYIDTQTNLSVFVFDSSGKLLLSQQINHSTTISLDNVTTPYIIIKYIFKKIQFTKKLLL